jgi:hypothetical protein
MKTAKTQATARDRGAMKAQWSNLIKPDAARFSDPEYMARLMPPPLDSELPKKGKSK